MKLADLETSSLTAYATRRAGVVATIYQTSSRTGIEIKRDPPGHGFEGDLPFYRRAVGIGRDAVEAVGRHAVDQLIDQARKDGAL